MLHKSQTQAASNMPASAAGQQWGATPNATSQQGGFNPPPSQMGGSDVQAGGASSESFGDGLALGDEGLAAIGSSLGDALGGAEQVGGEQRVVDALDQVA